MGEPSNQLPVLVELFQEFRSTEWQQAEAYVIGRLRAEYDPGLGCSALPDEARIAVNKVVGFFSGFGDRYASLFEDFVWRVRRNRSLDTSYGYRLKSLPVGPERDLVPEKPQIP